MAFLHEKPKERLHLAVEMSIYLQYNKLAEKSKLALPRPGKQRI